MAIARFQYDVPYIGFLAFFPVLLIVQVLSMGVHKYGTSNRLLGYELHLQRTAHFITRDRCYEIMQQVGWEEALRAWRVVQPTLWDQIYQPVGAFKKRFYALRIKRTLVYEIEDEVSQTIDYEVSQQQIVKTDAYTEFWFDQQRSFSSLQRGKVKYNAGGYLTNMIVTFLVAITMCLILPTIGLCQIWYLHTVNQINPLVTTLDIVCSVIYGLCIGFLNLVLLNIRSRIRILESGLLSIHSSAILWEAVVLAHLRALEDLGFFDDRDRQPHSMHGYTRYIAAQAADISCYASNIHKWIDESRKKLDKTLRLQTRGPTRG